MYPILLIVLIVASVIMASLMAALIADGGKVREFDLPEKRDREAIIDSAARLAVMPRVRIDIRGDITLSIRYITKAFAVIRRKAAIFSDIDAYEKRFGDNYYLIKQTIVKVLKALPKLAKISARRSGGVVELAGTIVSMNAGVTDNDLVKRAVNAYGARRTLTYSELKLLGDALNYALIKQVAVYASKILYRYRAEKKARSDAEKRRISERYTHSLCYMKTLYALSDTERKQRISEYCAARGANIYTAASDDERVLASYCGGIDALTDSLRAQSVDAHTAIELSAAGKIYARASDGWHNVTHNTQCAYLEMTERMAVKRKVGESVIASETVRRAQKEGKDISEYIIPEANELLPKLSATAVVVISLVACILSGIFFPAAVACRIIFAIALFPVMFKSLFVLCDELTVRLVVKRPIPECKIKFLPKTAIVVCAVVKSSEDVFSRIRDLTTILKANDEGGFSYGLILDCVESGYGVIEAEKDICKIMRGADKRIFVCLRKNATERKRGALIDFNKLVLYGDRTPFALILGAIKNFRYAITLDSDTMLTDAKKLVGIMEHPYNSRYAIASLSMRANTFALTTPFSSLYCGEKGLSSYSSSTSIYFNACGFGCYTGKGIYRIKETNDAVADAFPDNRILSHDMIEGALAGCCDSGVCGSDEFPKTFTAYFTRAERWMRGDLQLLPFIGKNSPNKFGRPRGKSICSAAKLTAVRNVIDVFVPIFSFITVVLAVISHSHLMFFAAFFPQALRLTFSTTLIFRMPKQFLRCAAIEFINAAMLPTAAAVSAKAAIYVLFSALKGRGLLKWRTYSSSLGDVQLYPANLVAAVTFAVVTPFTGFIAVLAAVLFAVAMPIGAILSSESRERKMRAEDRDFAVSLAEKTWEYFTRALCAYPKYLPSDNYSDENGWADRTSPTNIGMALCAAVCARELGIITEQERDVTVAAILDETEKLEKYKGCLFNWYSVSDGKPLTPRYISSVDHGNFIAALAVVAVFVPAQAKRAQALVLQSDVDFLKSDKGLFHIGYSADKGEADRGTYDLLGSESALTYLILNAFGRSDKEAFRNLSRRSVKAGGKKMLASWSGGAFEYLLPLLFFKAPKKSLLGKSAIGTLYAQKRYASKCRSSLWGASESLYAERYDNGDLKYRAFGVPEISLSSDSERKVFAPYAAVMYFGIVSHRKVRLRDMLSEYVCEYGLYDSVDEEVGKVQKSAMSHHQGMIMLALCAALCDDAIRTRLTEDAGIRAAELLLDEDAYLLEGAETRKTVKITHVKEINGYYAGGRSKYPQLNFLSDGRYRCVTDEYGRGYSIVDGLPLTRFDITGGVRVKVKFGEQIIDPCTEGTCFHGVCRSEFSCVTRELDISVIHSLLFGENAEIRRIKCKNLTDKPVAISVIVGTKPILCHFSTDISHKAYSSMFIETSFDERGFVYARRTDGKANGILAMFSDKGAEYFGDELYAETGKGVRFGRTTEPWLGADIPLIVPEGKEVCADIFMAYGTVRDIAALKRKTFDKSFTNYSLVKSAAYKSAYLSEQARCVGAILLFGGKVGGVPQNINVRADDDTSGAAINLLHELLELEKFGCRFTVTVTGSVPYSYADCRRTELLEAMAALGEKCRTADEYANDVPPGSIDAFSCRNVLLPPFYLRSPSPSRELKPELPSVVYSLGLGGFTSLGEYLITANTPVPWHNIISDGKIGCITSDIGGFTFASNSRQEKYTRYSGEELNDFPGDGAIIGEGGTVWSITRKPCERGNSYAALHGKGYSIYYCGYNGLYCSQKVFVNGGVKYIVIKIINPYARKRVLDVMYFAETILGDFYEECVGGIEFGKVANGLFAIGNGMKLYLTCNKPSASTAFRAESYRDRAGRFRVCADLYDDGMIPALAYSCRIAIAGKSSEEVVFAMSDRYVVEIIDNTDAASVAFEKIDIPRGEVTGDGRYGIYAGWLYYQTYISRFIAKCGYQQVGGAIGFRDRLQDSMALIGTVPNKVREFLIECAAHQFEDGDVMHWWHEPRTGVRTRICDDKLFLPYAVAEYVDRTGDENLLSESAPYLKNKTLPSGEHSVYACMEESNVRETLRAHIMRAFRSVKLSSRGLVIMGTGDWNDGMDRLGEKGRGESVWCSMFAYYVAGRFLPYAEKADRFFLSELRKTLKAAIPQHKRGNRYVRAYTDEGEPIGVAENKECRIDLLVQSWAVLSGLEQGDDAVKILEEAYDELYDKEHKLIKLLDPPFTDRSIGYIADYPPGVRENGGQYTHAAVWFIRALFMAGMRDKANELLSAILPDSHTSDTKGVETYLKEPYVLAGDVYAGELIGRGGWTWYTGAAGWLYRVITEDHYGVVIRRGAVRFRPALAVGEKAELTVRLESGNFTLVLDGTEDGDWHLSIDGIEYGVCALPITSLEGKTVTLTRRKKVE